MGITAAAGLGNSLPVWGRTGQYPAGQQEEIGGEIRRDRTLPKAPLHRESLTFRVVTSRTPDIEWPESRCMQRRHHSQSSKGSERNRTTKNKKIQGSFCSFFGEGERTSMVWEELRSAVRFPMHLPVVLIVEGEEIHALTVNISHNGVLLQVPYAIAASSGLEFLLEVPKEVTLNESTAAIHCAGHVIRSFEEDGTCFVAAVIDEYRFQ
jgi:hypothetical protein